MNVSTQDAGTATSDGRIAGKVCLVTGAGGGIGRATMLRFAREGAHVFGVDLAAEALAGTMEALAREGLDGAVLASDVTDEDAVAQVVHAAKARFGPIDVLVNVVGGGRAGRLWELSVDDWDFVMRLNLRSAFLCTRAVVPQMMERRSGRIIALSSGARNGTPWEAYNSGQTAYATTKAGIAGFVRNASLELVDHGITVNAVAPGPIVTERNAQAFEDRKKLDHNFYRYVPMKRPGVPDEIANAILFLASDESSYMTGVTLDVMGGR